MSWEKKTYHGHRERLRQKFRTSGISGFHDYEVLELLLTFSIPRVDVKPYAKGLLQKFGSLRGVLEAPRHEISRVPGVGDNASILIALLKELSANFLVEGASPAPSLNQPEDVASFVAENLESYGDEALFALYLDSRNRPVGLETIVDGRPDILNVSKKIVIKKALERNARSIIFVHHGAVLSAAEDDAERPVAMALRSVASTIDVVVHDYIIMAGGEVLSARSAGWFGGGGGRRQS